MNRPDTAQKITPEHLARKAVVYLRQSSPAQVKHNQKSQRLQYALAGTAKAYGFKRVDVIDCDLGASAAPGAQACDGFKQLLASVALGEIGLVLSRELSRLSRTDKDWCHLLELRQVFNTLIADALDGVYVYRDNRPPRFQRVKAPDKSELEELVQLISQRVGRSLERQGLLEQDTESAWLDLNPAEDTDAMPQILGSSITYRIAVGPQQGRKAFMIRTIRPLDRPDPGLERVARANGFSLHAGVSCEGHQKEKREPRAAFRCAVTLPALLWQFPGFH